VSSPDLERLIQAARQAGAYGAKLSGGGRGGNMIALAPIDATSEVVEALTKASAKSSLVTVVSS
jgi:mevalonate kinase